MKTPSKFSIFAILYVFKEGIWEHEVYSLLKDHYSKKSLSKTRSILIEMLNKSWTDEVDAVVFDDNILRKYKLQERHREFVKYQLSPESIINELGIGPSIHSFQEVTENAYAPREA
jgi:methyltransferase-like protein